MNNTKVHAESLAEQTSVFAPGTDAGRENLTTNIGLASQKAGVFAKGSVIGKYRIVRELGRGGQGKVFLAEDTKLGRLVALKTVTAASILSETSLKRFHNEARAIANLRSSNIVQLYEIFEHHGLPFLVMEYVDGETLLQRCRSNKFDRLQLLHIISLCCKAVDMAHKQGIIHRDLKPQNIMIARDGTPKVMDFGLAKSILGDSNYTVATMDGQVIGSPAYMSPEQAAGELVGAQSDVFALGTVLYQCISGKLPHAADTPMETILRVMNEEPEPLTNLDPTININLNAIVMKALEKSVLRRYANAGELAEDLDRFLRGESVLARPETMLERLAKGIRRNSDVALLSGICLTIVAAVLAGSIWLFARQSAVQISSNLKTELKMMANTAALMFPADETFPAAVESTATPAFKSLVLRLNEIRRRNTRVDNVWIFCLDENRRNLLYVADADAFLPGQMRPREVGAKWDTPTGSAAIYGFAGALSDELPVSSDSGHRWSGYAPIYDAAGQPVSVLAIEMPAEELSIAMRPALRTTVQVGSLGAVLFCGFTIYAARRVLRRRQRRLP